MDPGEVGVVDSMAAMMGGVKFRRKLLLGCGGQGMSIGGKVRMFERDAAIPNDPVENDMSNL